jgi:Arc/MetJ-type ribon-helix-helix transcriptional regulator
MQQITIEEDLLAQAHAAAEQEGYSSVDDFVASAIQERLGRFRKERFLQASQRIRKGLHASGLTEEQVPADFEQFRDELASVKPGE